MSDCPFKVGDIVNYKPTSFYIQNEQDECICSQETQSSWPDAKIVSIDVNGFTYEYDKPYIMHARLNWVSNGGYVYAHAYNLWKLVKTA